MKSFCLRYRAFVGIRRRKPVNQGLIGFFASIFAKGQADYRPASFCRYCDKLDVLFGLLSPQRFQTMSNRPGFAAGLQ
jgi:hypothetical protein